MPRPSLPPGAQDIGAAMLKEAMSKYGKRKALDNKQARYLLRLAMYAGIGIFLFFTVMGAMRSGNLVAGIFTGLLAGFFATLLFGGAVAWILMSLIVVPSPGEPIDPAESGELETLLGPTLSELEKVRAEVLAEIKQRSRMRVPIGLGGAVLFWLLMQTGDDPPGMFGLFCMLCVGGFGGAALAAENPGARYKRLYKERVLPALAGRFGALSYRTGKPDSAWLGGSGLFNDFDRVFGEDEIYGTYKEYPLRVLETRLELGAGDDKRIIFDGLLVEIVLPRHLKGRTAIVIDQNVSNALVWRFKRPEFAAAKMTRVRLEDPEFERQYEVFGSDQIEARALLTPAFMERFLGLSKLGHFGLPVAMAEANHLTVALPKNSFKNLFEPPPYSEPVGGGTQLVGLSRDIRAVLGMVDTVIALDSGLKASALLDRTPNPLKS